MSDVLDGYIVHTQVRFARERILNHIRGASEKATPATQQNARPKNPLKSLNRGLFVVGPAGVGKSTLLEDITMDEEFEAFDDPDTGLVQPIVTVEAPTSSSFKSLMEEILQALGDPYWNQGTVTQMKIRMKVLLQKQRTKLLVIDEVHQLSRADKKYADFLKDLLNKAPCPIIFAGIDEALDLPASNKQLFRRCRSAIILKPFDWFNSADRQEMLSFLLTIVQEDPKRYKKLPIADPDGALPPAIHIATGGCIGLMLQLLESTFEAFAERMFKDPTSDPKHANVKDMAVAFDKLCASVKAKPQYNPFVVKALPETWSGNPFITRNKQSS